MEKYYAHSRGDNPDEWQRLENHLRQSAELAGEFADAWNAGNLGYMIWERMQSSFQRYWLFS